VSLQNVKKVARKKRSEVQKKTPFMRDLQEITVTLVAENRKVVLGTSKSKRYNYVVLSFRRANTSKSQEVSTKNCSQTPTSKREVE
jgi:hypothetical protein